MFRMILVAALAVFGFTTLPAAAEQPLPPCSEAPDVPGCAKSATVPAAALVGGKGGRMGKSLMEEGDALTAESRATASRLRWIVRNNARATVWLRLFGLNRGWVWPGKKKVLVMQPGKSYSILVKCVRGERVAYGAALAANTNFYWGVGLGGNRACSNCVAICNGSTIRLTLTR